MITKDAAEWQNVLDFWFPEGRGLDVNADIHRANWMWRMRGGADEQIIAEFRELTGRAIQGNLGHWSGDPHGRQFPRSIWRDTPLAFAQDERALSLALDGYSNGHYDALETPWFKTVHDLPLQHCEGPDHIPSQSARPLPPHRATLPPPA